MWSVDMRGRGLVEMPGRGLVDMPGRRRRPVLLPAADHNKRDTVTVRGAGTACPGVHPTAALTDSRGQLGLTGQAAL